MTNCNKVNTPKQVTSGHLLEMEDQSETSQPEAATEEDTVKVNQASSVIEIRDSASECEAEPRPSPVEMEERSFVSSLYSFMKDKVTPIERIPHLGFKQINLWRIYKAVEKLGGYDSVTAGRLWKNVYDELGGSPGSTSAATCTRRHYERLVLPFERHLRGEEDKPLPPGKPRKQYKRNLDGKVSKTEGKRKRTQSEREMDSSEAQETPEAAGPSETGKHGHPTSWAITSVRDHPVCSQPNRVADDLSSGLSYSHLVQVPTSSPWGGHIPSAGEVISPLEKKKRVAQASLSLPLSPSQGEGKDRPSVIHCSQSPGLATSSQTCNSSEGSPLPLSSSSSRSTSPYSVSSEDCPALSQDKPASNTELPPNCLSSFTHIPVSGCSEDSTSLSCSPKTKELAGQFRDIPHISPQPPNTDSNKGQSGASKDSVWNPVNKRSGRYPAQSWPLSTPCSVKSDWTPASTSSFTKVIPKSVEPLRPIPFQPAYKLYQRRSMPHDDSLICEKKLHNMPPWLHQTEKKKSRAMLPKPLPTQQSLSHSNASLPVSYLLTGCDRSGRDLRHHPYLYPAFLPPRMRPTHSQPVYRHVSIPSALFGSAIYSYPYPIPLWYPQTGYNLTGMNSMHPHKL